MTPYYEQSGVIIYHGDCHEVLDGCFHDGGSFGMVDITISDPPYDARTHIGARSHGETASRIDFAPLDIGVSLPLLLAVSRRWVVSFCTMEMIAEYQRVAGAAWVRAGFWRRPDGAPQFTGDRPGTPGDAVAIMHKAGKKRWNGGGHHAFWEYGVERAARVHPAQKPEALMCELVHQFSEPSETILDPFMGSGTTLVAAKRLGRQCVGIEREEKYCEIAANRLRQEALPLEMGA